MQKLLICGCFILQGFFASAQNAPASKPSLRVKAYEQYFLSGVAQNPIVEVGGKEIPYTPKKSNPDFFIYLIANKVPYIKIERVWIKQQLYFATVNKITKKPVVLVNGKLADTLVKYTDEAVWQIKLTGKDSTGIKPKKDIAKLVSSNELVLRLNDKNGKLYTRSLKSFVRLEAARGM